MSCCSDLLFVLWRSFRRIMYPRNKIYKYHISALHSLTLLCILSLLFTTCPITVTTRESVYKFVINLRYLYRITKSKPVENCDVNHFLSVCVEVKRITCVKHFSCNFYSLSRSHIPKRETNEWVHLLDCVIVTRWSIFVQEVVCYRKPIL